MPDCRSSIENQPQPPPGRKKSQLDWETGGISPWDRTQETRTESLDQKYWLTIECSILKYYFSAHSACLWLLRVLLYTAFQPSHGKVIFCSILCCLRSCHENNYKTKLYLHEMELTSTCIFNPNPLKPSLRAKQNVTVVRRQRAAAASGCGSNKAVIHLALLI